MGSGGQRGSSLALELGKMPIWAGPRLAAEAGFHPDGHEKTPQAASRSGWWRKIFFPLAFLFT